MFSVQQIQVASGDHLMLMDLLDCCRGPFDEAVLRLRLNAATQLDIALALGSSQPTVSRALAGIYARAEVKDEDDPVRLGMALRGSLLWRNLSAEVVQPLTGLRFPKHKRLHKECWCLRKAVPA